MSWNSSFFRITLFTIYSTLSAVKDYLTCILPRGIFKKDFAFLVHPRGLWDTYKPFPLLKYFPYFIQDLFSYLQPAIVLSHIEGVRSLDGRPLKGILIATVNTPHQMRRAPLLAVFRTMMAGLLGEKRGAKIIGLGAYLPAISDYGRRFLNHPRIFKGNYTTGHATTAWMISEFVKQTIEMLKVQNAVVAIVGGAGSTGTACAKVVPKIASNVAEIALFDVNRESKIERMAQTRDDLKETCKVSIHTDLDDLRDADIIIVVTTAEGTIIKSEHLKPGAVIIDDSQPRNTNPALMDERDDVVIVDVLSRFPGLNANFDFDLVENDPEICFTCLAETAILAAHNWNKHFSIGILDEKKVFEIRQMGEALGVTTAPYLSFNKPIKKSQWLRVYEARQKNLGLPVETLEFKSRVA